MLYLAAYKDFCDGEVSGYTALAVQYRPPLPPWAGPALLSHRTGFQSPRRILLPGAKYSEWGALLYFT